MSRALSVDNILATKYDVFEFEGEWEAFINKPERKGVWFIYAGSGSGKSSFVMQLAKYLTKFGNVLYNSREEGTAKSFKDRLEMFGMNEPEVKKNFKVVDEDRPTLDKRLAKRRSPDIVIVDSLQYFKMNWKEYLEFKHRWRNKTIIIVSHAKGRDPKNLLATDIMFDAYIKIFCEGYKAITRGREIGRKGYFVIWLEGYNKIWGEKSKQVNQDTNGKQKTHTKSIRHNK